MGRSVLHWACVFALGVVPLVGCADVVVGTGGIGGTSGEGGGAGAGGGGSSDLKVVSTTPGDGDTGVTVDLASFVLAAVFDQPLDPATVDQTTFTLQGPNGAVPGSAALANDTTATFTPDAAPALATGYTATLGAGIRSLDGASLGRVVSWRFETRDGQWGNARLAEDDETGAAVNVRFAMNDTGRAVVSWAAFHGGLTDVFVNYYDPASGWQGVQALRRDIASAPFPSVTLTIDADGNALGVWGERQDVNPPGTGPGFDATDPTTQFAATYDAAIGTWSAPVAMENDNTGRADVFEVASGRAGRFFVVFGLNMDTTLSIYANRFTQGAGWSGPELLDSADKDSTDTFLSPVRVGVDDAGNALAAWSRYTDSDNSGTINRTLDTESVFARRFDAGAGNWGALETLNTSTGGSAFAYDVQATGNDFLVLWYQNDAMFRTDGWASFHRPDTGWAAAQRLWDTSTHDLFPSALAFDAQGNATVIVNGESNATGSDDILAIAYTTAGGWQAPSSVENRSADSVFQDLDVNSAGDAVVVWREGPSGFRDVYASVYDTVSGTWSSPELAEAPETGDVRDVAAELDAAGNALAVWRADDDVNRNIFAARYRPGSGWAAPSAVDDSDDDASTNSLRLGMDRRGAAVAVWAQGPNGDEDVHFNRFD